MLRLMASHVVSTRPLWGINTNKKEIFLQDIVTFKLHSLLKNKADGENKRNRRL